MPARRKNGRKFAGRRKQSGGRSAVLSAPIPLANSGGGFRLQRTVLATTLTLVAGAPTLSALQLLMGAGGSLPSALRTFIQTWDLMWLRSVRVRLIPRWNVNTTTEDIPQIAFVANYDDVVAPGSVDYVLGQQGARLRRFDRPVSVFTTPAAPTSIGGTAASTFLIVRQGQWYNAGLTNSTLVTYPLAKIGITAVTNFPGTGIVDVYYDIDVQLRQALSG